MRFEDKLSVDEKLLVDEPASAADIPSPGLVPAGGQESAAVLRFRSCRWRKAAENGTPECCGHRDVLPLTGTNGFDAEAWCPECGFYKLRRTPKKREDFGFRY